MSFVLYKKTRATSDEETVSITSAGVIVLSAACTEKYMKDHEYVQLYFDSAAKRVGIKPLRREEKYSYRVIRPANSKRAAFSGRGFLRTYKVNEGEKGRFKPQTFEANFAEGMITFDVK